MSKEAIKPTAREDFKTRLQKCEERLTNLEREIATVRDDLKNICWRLGMAKTDCTDLKQQPTAGDFTTNIRDVLKVMDKDGKFHRKIMEDACHIIDASEAEKKELLEALKTALPFVVAHDIQQKVVSGAALQIQAIIAKVKG